MEIAKQVQLSISWTAHALFYYYLFRLQIAVLFLTIVAVLFDLLNRAWLVEAFVLLALAVPLVIRSRCLKTRQTSKMIRP